jgi:hypothetical protein
MKTKYYFSVLFFLCSFVIKTSTAQVPTYFLYATCFFCGFAGPNAFNFSIYFGSHDSTYFEYSGGQYCFEVDTSIANGGELTYQIISSGLPVNVRPGNPTVTRNKKYFILNLERNVFPGPGNGFNMSRRAVYAAIMRVTTTAATIGDPMSKNMNWRNSAVDSIYSTRIFAYVNMVNTEITTPATHGMDFMFPVELSYFSSSVNGNIITLNWATTSELNNSGFDIERSEVKGEMSNDWKKISFVEGNGTTTLPGHYIFTDRNLSTGVYKYRLKQIDYNGNFEYFNLSNEVAIGVPKEFKLSQNYPNPFNPTTNINYKLPFEGKVSLKVFDMTGKELKTLIDEFKTAGYYTIEFNGTNFSSGIYYYKLESRNGQAGTFKETRKMLLIK